jgi:hypothetical protein
LYMGGCRECRLKNSSGRGQFTGQAFS